jgi:hypothetical protein
MIAGDFDPHFSVKHMLKDVQIAARMARSYGLTLGATEAARDSLLDEAQSGRGDQDFASLVRFFFPKGLPGEITDEAEDDDASADLKWRRRRSRFATTASRAPGVGRRRAANRRRRRCSVERYSGRSRS